MATFHSERHAQFRRTVTALKTTQTSAENRRYRARSAESHFPAAAGRRIGRDQPSAGAATAGGGAAPTGTAGIAWLAWPGPTEPTLMPVMQSADPG